jgi:CheY-like chemotaxis protein
MNATAVIIDDEVQIRRLLRMALEAKGYRVFEAENGQLGLGEIVFHKPDVVVLDMGLPDMDGLEVLKKLREWSTVPVVILSVRDQADDKIAALESQLGTHQTGLATLTQERDDPTITGLGIDEDTAMVVDGDGIGHFYNRGVGYAWLIRPLKKPTQIVAGQPLTYRRVPIVGIGPESTLDLKSFRVTRPAFTATADVVRGVLVTTPRVVRH